MQQSMGGTLTYRHEDDMNFATVMDDILVGSCLQTPEDVDRSSCCAPCHYALCCQHSSCTNTTCQASPCIFNCPGHPNGTCSEGFDQHCI